MAAFAEGQYFAWNRTVHRAKETCEVCPHEINGDATELIRLQSDCTLQEATIVLNALHADTRYLAEELTDGD